MQSMYPPEDGCTVVETYVMNELSPYPVMVVAW
jgi:hypothetical protein